MPAESRSRLLVTNPLRVEGPGMATYLSRELVPEAACLVKIGWITGAMSRPLVTEHRHDQDEILIIYGSDHEHPQVLGGEVEMTIGGQPSVLTTTTGLYLPCGVTHGPMRWRTVDRPQVLVSITLPPQDSVRRPGKTPFDYEQYIIRSPMREAGAEMTAGRTAPTMTYMSGVQIPGVKTYIEFGWTFGQPASARTRNAMPSMAHPNFDEVVLHIGGDPKDPTDLGGDIEFVVGGEPLRFSTTSALFIPRTVDHGPIRCLAYRKPHIVMAIMLGAGSVKEGWEGSFKKDPEP